MKDIKKQINEDFKRALKQKDELVSGVLRMVKSAIKNTEIEKRKELSPEEITAILSKEAKKRKEAVLLYKKGKREDLALKEKNEIKILSTYLPQMLSEGEIRKFVLEIISKTKAKGISDFGKVMGKVMSELKGKTDGAKVSQIVRGELNKL
jgi:uncharacterized protein